MKNGLIFIIAFFLPYVAYSTQKCRLQRSMSTPTIKKETKAAQGVLVLNHIIGNRLLSYVAFELSKIFPDTEAYTPLARMRDIYSVLPATQTSTPLRRSSRLVSFKRTLPAIATVGLLSKYLDSGIKFEPLSLLAGATLLQKGAGIAAVLAVLWAIKHEISDLIYGRYKEREKRLELLVKVFTKEVTAELEKYKQQQSKALKETKRELSAFQKNALKDEFEAYDKLLKEIAKSDSLEKQELVDSLSRVLVVTKELQGREEVFQQAIATLQQKMDPAIAQINTLVQKFNEMRARLTPKQSLATRVKNSLGLSPNHSRSRSMAMDTYSPTAASTLASTRSIQSPRSADAQGGRPSVDEKSDF